jgi:polysaccharide export outer membrane protein
MIGLRFTAVCCCLISGVLAQSQPEKNWNDKIQQLSFARRPVTDYRIGSGDLIEIKVFGEDRLSQQARISPSGEIAMPFLGNVQASGLTQFELEEKISSLLKGRLLQNPQVTVFIREYRSQPVFVLGAVKNPGNYQITQRLNLVDALAMAGGLDLARAGEEMIVQRPAAESDPNATPELIKVDLKQLLEEGNLALNLPLQGGDIIQVPERTRRFFYVIGEVHRPGVFELPPEQDTYVTQALAQAGGPMRTAKTNKGILVRFDDQGGRQEVALNIEDILKGRKSDLTVNPNDVIFVPGSTFKNIGYGLLGVIPSTVSSSIVYGTTYR